jgi:hypothetical protein
MMITIKTELACDGHCQTEKITEISAKVSMINWTKMVAREQGWKMKNIRGQEKWFCPTCFKILYTEKECD